MKYEAYGEGWRSDFKLFLDRGKESQNTKHIKHSILQRF